MSGNKTPDYAFDENKDYSVTQGDGEVPSYQNGFKRGGHRLLFGVVCVLLAGLAAPLLFIFFAKSPDPDEHLLILGISYYKLVFIFLLSSAIMVHASLFFLRVKPLILFIFFVLSLFCCFPFIVGLRNGLTLKQVILEIPFFSGWPFFLRPAYVLIEFLIPMGIVIWLLLQIRSIFSKKHHGYPFLGVAIYLSGAAFLGFSGLLQAQQPNIGTALARLKGNLVQQDENSALLRTSTPPLEIAAPQLARQLKLPIQSNPNNTGEEKIDSETGDSPATKLSPSGHEEKVDVLREVRLLSEKVDRITVKLDQISDFAATQGGNRLEKSSSPATQEKVVKEPSEEKMAVVELQQEVRLLSDKVDHISNALNQMASLLPERKEIPQKTGSKSLGNTENAGGKKGSQDFKPKPPNN